MPAAFLPALGMPGVDPASARRVPVGPAGRAALPAESGGCGLRLGAQEEGGRRRGGLCARAELGARVYFARGGVVSAAEIQGRRGCGDEGFTRFSSLSVRGAGRIWVHGWSPAAPPGGGGRWEGLLRRWRGSAGKGAGRLGVSGPRDSGLSGPGGDAGRGGEAVSGRRLLPPRLGRSRPTCPLRGPGSQPPRGRLRRTGPGAAWRPVSRTGEGPPGAGEGGRISVSGSDCVTLSKSLQPWIPGL